MKVLQQLCHRDYEQPGGSVAVAIYDDRVEIINTGRLPKGLSVKNWLLPHKSIPINPLIANIFYRRKLIESWGRGFELMAAECETAGLQPPAIIDTDGEVVITFYRRDYNPPTHMEHINPVVIFTDSQTASVTDQVTLQICTFWQPKPYSKPN